MGFDQLFGDGSAAVLAGRHHRDTRLTVVVWRDNGVQAVREVVLRSGLSSRPVEYPQLHPPERETLEQFLEQHRAMVLAALDGLTDEAAAARLLPATGMTIGGIVKHLAHMEDLWFTCRLLGAAYPPPWVATGDDETWAWESAGDDSVESLRALYEQACARSRAAVARFADLDQRAAQPSFGQAPVSLRWMIVQMIRETAQHQGHLDLMLDAARRV